MLEPIQRYWGNLRVYSQQNITALLQWIFKAEMADRPSKMSKSAHIFNSIWLKYSKQQFLTALKVIKVSQNGYLYVPRQLKSQFIFHIL